MVRGQTRPDRFVFLAQVQGVRPLECAEDPAVKTGHDVPDALVFVPGLGTLSLQGQ